MSQIEQALVTPSDLLEQPWLVYEVPYFHDEWEEYIRNLPRNLELVHQLGSRAYFETFEYRESGQKMRRLEDFTMFADFGVQPEEDIFAETFARVKYMCRENPETRYLHVRHDLEGAVEETWKNAPFRNIAGHSFHKIPESLLATDYIEVDGQWWHKRDYYEAQMLADQN